MNNSITLKALDGSNPLAFLAALGTLRVLTHRFGTTVKLRWVRDGFWRPELTGVNELQQEISQSIHAALKVPTERFKRLGKDITVSPRTFELFVRDCEDGLTGQDRSAADFAAAFGSEVCAQPRDENKIQYTDLCFMTGSGHQHFLGTMEALTQCVEVSHVRDALFGSWRRDKGNSMRWDPQDAAEYALRWGDPSLDGASAVWGANLLAVEALPLFPSFPDGRGWLKTTGFVASRDAEWPEFSWPIWTAWANEDVARSLLGLDALAELGRSKPKDDHRSEEEFYESMRQRRQQLTEMGVAEVYRAARVRIGKGANFKVSFRPATAV